MKKKKLNPMEIVINMSKPYKYMSTSGISDLICNFCKVNGHSEKFHEMKAPIQLPSIVPNNTNLEEMASMDKQEKIGGIKHDDGKPRWDLLPYDAVEGAIIILTEGAHEYGERNWEEGMQWSRPYAALQRHITSWWNGESFDKKSGKSHLWHALCELLFLVAYERRGLSKTFDDRPLLKKVPPISTSSEPLRDIRQG